MASGSARGWRGRGTSRSAEECQPAPPDLVRGASEPDEMRLGVDVERLARAAERGEARGMLGRDRGVVRTPDDQRRLLDRVVARAHVLEVEHEATAGPQAPVHLEVLLAHRRVHLAHESTGVERADLAELEAER